MNVTELIYELSKIKNPDKVLVIVASDEEGNTMMPLNYTEYEDSFRYCNEQVEYTAAKRNETGFEDEPITKGTQRCVVLYP